MTFKKSPVAGLRLAATQGQSQDSSPALSDPGQSSGTAIGRPQPSAGTPGSNRTQFSLGAIGESLLSAGPVSSVPQSLMKGQEEEPGPHTRERPSSASRGGRRSWSPSPSLPLARPRAEVIDQHALGPGQAHGEAVPFIFHQQFPGWQMCGCVFETAPLAETWIRNPALKSLVIYPDNRRLKWPLRVLYDPFEDCFP